MYKTKEFFRITKLTSIRSYLIAEGFKFIKIIKAGINNIRYKE